MKTASHLFAAAIPEPAFMKAIAPAGHLGPPISRELLLVYPISSHYSDKTAILHVWSRRYRMPCRHLFVVIAMLITGVLLASPATPAAEVQTLQQKPSLPIDNATGKEMSKRIDTRNQRFLRGVKTKVSTQQTSVKETIPTLKYHLPENSSDQERERQPISAEKVVQAIRAGWSVDIENAVIRGPFIFKSASAEGAISIKQTKITGPLDWSYATFKGLLILEGVIFEEEVNLTGVAIEKDIFLNKAIFKENAIFRDLKVSGVFYGRMPIFGKGAIFERAFFTTIPSPITKNCQSVERHEYGPSR